MSSGPLTFLSTGNQSNASNATTTDSASACYSFETGNYVLATLAITGAVANVFNIVVFSREKMRKNSMNLYLLAKSASDLYFMLMLVLEPVSSCADCFVYYSYSYQVFVWVYRGYVGLVATLASIMLEVMATFDRYVAVSQSCKFYKRLKTWAIIAAIFAYSALFYTFNFFVYVIKESKNTNGTSVFSMDYSDFGSAVGYEIFPPIHSLQRDGVCVALIVIFNALIMVHLKRAMAKKKTMSRSLANKTVGKTSSRADRAELNITIMVVLTGVTQIVAHLLQLVSFLPVPAIYFITFSVCFEDANLVIFALASAINFSFYFFFNNVFRETFLRLFGRVKARSRQSESEHTKTALRAAQTIM